MASCRCAAQSIASSSSTAPRPGSHRQFMLLRGGVFFTPCHTGRGAGAHGGQIRSSLGRCADGGSRARHYRTRVLDRSAPTLPSRGRAALGPAGTFAPALRARRRRRIARRAQSPRGESEPPEPTFGPLGIAERLNWLVSKKRSRNTRAMPDRRRSYSRRSAIGYRVRPCAAGARRPRRGAGTPPCSGGSRSG